MKKSEIYTEKGVNLASKVPAEIAAEFRRQAKETPGQNVKTCLAAAAQLWVALPAKLRLEILANLNGGDLYSVVSNWIRDDEVKKYLDKLSPEDKKKILVFATKTK